MQTRLQLETMETFPDPNISYNRAVEIILNQVAQVATLRDVTHWFEKAHL